MYPQTFTTFIAIREDELQRMLESLCVITTTEPDLKQNEWYLVTHGNESLNEDMEKNQTFTNK